MLRIFSILVLSILFLIISLNVGILTSKKSENVILQMDEKEPLNDFDTKIDETVDPNLEENIILDEKSEVLTSYTIDSKLIEDKKNQEIDETAHLEPEKNPTTEEKKESLPVKPKKKPENLTNQYVKNELKDNEKGNDNSSKDFFIQYGAFSKKINANHLKERIEKKLKLKYPDFNLIITKSTKKGLFKVIFETDNKALADEICIYSKKINISCLFQKR